MPCELKTCIDFHKISCKGEGHFCTFPTCFEESPTSPGPVERPCSPPIMQTIFEHGGSRIWREVDGRRQLIADTYGSAGMALAVKKCIEDFMA